MTQKLKHLIERKKITDYDKWFSTIAEELLLRTHLKIEGRLYEIIEAEFYINEPHHPDLFSHSTEDQTQNGIFYFHKHGPSYREGNYMGLDLAIGNEERFGGILIRGLKDLETKKIIDGPSNVVSEILKRFGAHKVRELVRRIDRSMEGPDLKLVEGKEKVALREVKLFRCPRVGLTLKKSAPEKIEFLIKDYRFLKYPELTKKGRHWIIASALVHNVPLHVPHHTAARFQELLDSGRNKKVDLHHYNHHSTRDDLIELYGAINYQEVIRTKLAS